MNHSPCQLYAKHRAMLATEARRVGIRRTAELAGLTPMIVSRFCHGSGGDDARVFYCIADALWFAISLAPPDKHRMPRVSPPAVFLTSSRATKPKHSAPR